MMSDSEYAEPDSSTADNETEEAALVEYEDEDDSDDNADETSEPQRAHDFLLTEAEVGDEESYYENSDDGQDIYETEEEAEAYDSQRPTAQDIENLRRARDPAILHMEKEQDIAEYLRNKYGEQLQAYKDVDDELADELQQQAFLPGI
ncbi:hypothetical protein B566_EDAN008262, partial [Ephemera danica]